MSTIEAAEKSSRHSPEAATAFTGNTKPVWLEPDLEFIRTLTARGGETFRKCFQCGTCSATCNLSPDIEPFPRKEMAWAVWGMKDRLLSDPDVWLCHQCTDCSSRCPRGARPGDLLAAVRQESVIHFSVPRSIGKLVNEPQGLMLMLGIPALLLTLALVLKDPIERILGLSGYSGTNIVFSYSSTFPHWLLNCFFLSVSILVFLVVIIGVVRFWRALKAGASFAGMASHPSKDLWSSIVSALKTIIVHREFAECASARTRYWSHLCVFFGFIALSVVTFWVITSGLNPLMKRDFVYPFSFWSPWKMLANLGGIALVAGCFIMILDRFREGQPTGGSAFGDWAFLWLLFIVALTGFVTEVLHYVRLEPHRHLAYFAHLIFACTLLLYLPYSKFAHIVYRTTAMVFAEHIGRSRLAVPVATSKGQASAQNAVDRTGALRPRTAAEGDDSVSPSDSKASVGGGA